jgi:hypothetical protein
MSKKKVSKNEDEEVVSKKKTDKESSDEEGATSEDSEIDPSIIEDTFSEEFGEYNDVDNY